MGKRPKTRMAVSERAKQFMPFKAVLGLDEALKEKELEFMRSIENSDGVSLPPLDLRSGIASVSCKAKKEDKHSV